MSWCSLECKQEHRTKVTIATSKGVQLTTRRILVAHMYLTMSLGMENPVSLKMQNQETVQHVLHQFGWLFSLLKDMYAWSRVKPLEKKRVAVWRCLSVCLSVCLCLPSLLLLFVEKRLSPLRLRWEKGSKRGCHLGKRVNLTWLAGRRGVSVTWERACFGYWYTNDGWERPAGEA